MLELVKLDVESRINKLLAGANGRRRVRTLDLDKVRDMARDARENGWVWDNGGTSSGSYRYQTWTTVVIVKQCGEDNTSLAIGVTVAPARATTPGRAWRALQPWTIHGPAGDAEAKWGHWLTGPKILILDGIEVDAFLEG